MDSQRHQQSITNLKLLQQNFQTKQQQLQLQLGQLKLETSKLMFEGFFKSVKSSLTFSQIKNSTNHSVSSFQSDKTVFKNQNQSNYYKFANNISQKYKLNSLKFLQYQQRILQYLDIHQRKILLPLCMLGCVLYGAYTIQQKHRSSNITNLQKSPQIESSTMQEMIQQFLTNYLQEIFVNDQIRSEGLHFLDIMFRDKQIHDASLSMIKKAVKDYRFVLESREYGIELSKYLVQQKAIQIESKELIIKTLCSDSELIQQEKEILKYFVNSPETKEIMKIFMTDVMLRDEVLSAIGRQMATATFSIAKGINYRTQFNLSIKEVMGRDDVQRNLKWLLLYKPLTNMCTLGFYSFLQQEETA